ncbi:MAG TPA: 23S rRNA (adenine(2503)-C(2))-methyltransferase RlmN [Spirochaetota bacterium]|nr:MAG: Dual-specificity RNA methyltransferase RlmN [Spirochaetes bacterium ADurb.Bin133]HNZ26979.1 23S rRNA (adenine(2503)-C(2))-methyltransferase RlmN [Spirochaetota bacterium]HPY88443.1 23S rRNA (adenine(2503)-C(2))-methyltransferase RlmN [Spirochaetota bacterium]
MNDSILNFRFDGLSEREIFDKPYRAGQIFKFIYENCIFDFNDMTNIPLNLRKSLSENFRILSIVESARRTSSDGVIKFLFELDDKNCVESVYLKDKNNRVTFCISSQCGCRMGCAFCKTGDMGLIRNLRADEILSQVLYLYKIMKGDASVVDKYFNIVFMGMGEPLDNLTNVETAISKLIDKKNLGISQTRITVSTCGIADKIEDLLKKFPNITLAVSLNSPEQSEREKMMPVSKKYPLNLLFQELKRLYGVYKNRITLEYVLIKGVNMRRQDVDLLSQIDKDIFHINLIPINVGGDDPRRPSEPEIKSFMDKLTAVGLKVTRRYRRGADINADCGQLFYEKFVEGVV